MGDQNYQKEGEINLKFKNQDLTPKIMLLIWSPGKPKPFLDENGKVLAGSISEKIHVSINGVKQGMFIKSRNKANPVLLFIHGGPSSLSTSLPRITLPALRTILPSVTGNSAAPDFPTALIFRPKPLRWNN